MTKRRSVKVQFDGSEPEQVDERDLPAILRERQLLEMLRTAYPPPLYDQAVIRQLFADAEILQQLEKSKRAAESARTLRKPHADQAAIEKCRDEYVYAEGKEHGWKAYACKKLKIDRKTLDARWAESKP